MEKIKNFSVTQLGNYGLIKLINLENSEGKIIAGEENTKEEMYMQNRTKQYNIIQDMEQITSEELEEATSKIKMGKTTEADD